jgi:hypothetical protein
MEARLDLRPNSKASGMMLRPIQPGVNSHGFDIGRLTALIDMR